MANIIKIKRRKDNAPNYDPTRVNSSGSGGQNLEYKSGDKCLYNGKIYVALYNNDAILPTNTTYWQETADVVNVGGAPTSLEAGEIAYNEVDNTLYYGSENNIFSLAGKGQYLSLDTTQTISGAKTFTSNVILSSAVVSTETTSSSSTKIANTEFVQNVFAIIDCGTFDDNNQPPPPPSIVGKYFYTTSSNGLDNVWWNLSNWWSDSSHTIQATTLPTSSMDVIILPPTNAIVDLDRTDWVQPKSINSGSVGVSFISQLSGNVSCDIVGDATFNGNSTFNK